MSELSDSSNESTVHMLNRAVARAVCAAMTERNIPLVRFPAVEDLHTNSVKLAGKRLRPFFETSRLKNWFENYLLAQAMRIAADVAFMGGLFGRTALKILEIGGMPFLFTEAISSLFSQHEIHSIDIEPSRVFLSDEFRFRIIKNDIEQDSLLTQNFQSFDLIVFHEIFEHLRLNPVRTLKNIRRYLKPGGIISLTTPNLCSSHKLRALVESGQAGPSFGQYRKLEYLGHMGHAREYSILQTVDALSLSGFSSMKMIFRGSDDEFGHYDGLGRYLAPLTHIIAVS
jgi:SAM-dependent methyltransferase